MIKIYRYKNKDVALTKIYSIIKEIIVKSNGKCALGLASGSTFKKTYESLSNDNTLNWANISTFNLDEYYTKIKNNIGKCYSFMFEYMNDVLFKNVNINYNNVHFPEWEVEEYDKKIKHFGGIKIQLLGIGRNGHIGFNEPHSKFNSKNRIVTLAETTIIDNGNAFFDGMIEKVPKKAVTMGIESILKAEKIVVAAFGEHKNNIMSIFTSNKEINEKYPITVVKKHKNVVFYVDFESLSSVENVDKEMFDVVDVK